MNVNKSNKRKWFHILKKPRSIWYPAETTIDEDDLVFLANTPTKIESLLYTQEQAAGGISLYVNTNKIEFVCFKQGAIFTLSGKALKLDDQFTYLGSPSNWKQCQFTYNEGLDCY